MSSNRESDMSHLAAGTPVASPRTPGGLQVPGRPPFRLPTPQGYPPGWNSPFPQGSAWDTPRFDIGTPAPGLRASRGGSAPPADQGATVNFTPLAAPASTPSEFPSGSVWNTPRFDIGTPAPGLRASRGGSAPPADQGVSVNFTPLAAPASTPSGFPSGSIWDTLRFEADTPVAVRKPLAPVVAPPKTVRRTAGLRARQDSTPFVKRKGLRSSAIMSFAPNGIYMLDLPGFASKHPSLTTPQVDRITFHISENGAIYWGALTADDGTVEVSLMIQRLPIEKRPTFSFTWCGQRENSRALIGPTCTGVFHFEGENTIVGHFKSLYDFRTEFIGHRNKTNIIAPLAAAKIKEHWTACHERLASITNIEEKYAKEQTEDELLASFVAGDSFIEHVDLDWAEKLPMLQQTRSYYLSTSHNINKLKFDSIQPQHLALEDLTLCRDEDGTMWGSFKIQNTKGVLRFDQFAYPLEPRLPPTYQFEWYGIETVGDIQTASQRSVRRGTGFITFENFCESTIHGRFNPPEGANLDSFSSSGGLADAGFWNASWQQPYDYYGYVNDAKSDLLDDQSAGRRISRSIPSMKGEWAEIRALWGVGAGEVDGGAESPWGLRTLRTGETLPEGAFGTAAAEALIASWTYEEDSEGGKESSSSVHGAASKKRSREEEEGEAEGEEEGSSGGKKKKKKKQNHVRFADVEGGEPATTTRKSGRKRTPTTRYTD
ncbi:uncharacterized protein BDZ99DRAFT_492764 [Mytilinidion resinicola]|uniref:Uncharacterized protein n=1 Tax=Mytilinidion resinicola TaxID=574789 RepID=A0A6A6Z6T2_9PEZI|nr:uncharacterized protein BDZ99DRAFT_492764 [Mytilinidion resinicola]KAF2816812.1 hypothetical protein BDZ99DRAFT_492764 [Mytilinidion resinicola]